MESAQSLLDRLLETPKPQASSERGQLDKDHAELHAGEDLNSIRGAPDPTAGPGKKWKSGEWLYREVVL